MNQLRERQGYFSWSSAENGAMIKVHGFVGSAALVEKVKDTSYYEDPEIQKRIIDSLVLARRRVDRFFIKGGLLISDGDMADLPKLNDRLMQDLMQSGLMVNTFAHYRDKYWQELPFAVPRSRKWAILSAPESASFLNSFLSASRSSVITFGR